MTLSQTFLTKAVEAMSKVDVITYRRIFNGAGIYHRGVQFSILINDNIYFRADQSSRILFEQKAMQAFKPQGTQIESCFYQVPESVLDNPSELRYWMRISVEAAHEGDFLDDEQHLDTPTQQNIQTRHKLAR
jgi:DNA transformation protein and related proteins